MITSYELDSGLGVILAGTLSPLLRAPGDPYSTVGTCDLSRVWPA